MPDSPESAGFFDAIKKIHEKTDAAASRKIPDARKPPRESLKVGVIAMPPDGELNGFKLFEKSSGMTC
jgi:hypothetical protein